MAKIWDTTGNGGLPEDWEMDEILVPSKFNREIRDRLDYLVGRVYSTYNLHGANTTRFFVDPTIPTTQFMTHPDVFNNTTPTSDFLVVAYTDGRIFVSFNTGYSWSEMPSGIIPFANGAYTDSDSTFDIYCAAGTTLYAIPGMSVTFTKTSDNSRIYFDARALYSYRAVDATPPARVALGITFTGSATGYRGTPSRGPDGYGVVLEHETHGAATSYSYAMPLNSSGVIRPDNMPADVYTVQLNVMSYDGDDTVTLGLASWNTTWYTVMRRQTHLYVAEV